MQEPKDWSRVDNHLEREFKFKDFTHALLFVNAVGHAAERMDHHPDIVIHYNKVKMVLWTHDKSAITDKDFTLAAKIDQLSGI